MSKPPTEADVLLAKRRIAYGIVRALEGRWPEIHHTAWDTDKAAKIVQAMIPSTNAEAYAELDEVMGRRRSRSKRK